MRIDEFVLHYAALFVRRELDGVLTGISVVYYSNRCSLLLTAFCCILVHFNAFNKISLHSILMHFRSAACLRMRLHLNVFM